MVKLFPGILALISLVLVVSLIVVGAYYIQSESSLQSLQQEVSVLKGQVSDYLANITSLQGKISSLNSTLFANIFQLSKAGEIIGLEAKTSWMEQQTITIPAGTHLSFNFSAGYAGYVTVNISSSTAPNTFVTVIWAAQGINYNQTVYVNPPTATSFPVLPSVQSGLFPCRNAYCTTNTIVQVQVGNANTVGNNLVTISVLYVY